MKALKCDRLGQYGLQEHVYWRPTFWDHDRAMCGAWWNRVWPSTTSRTHGKATEIFPGKHRALNKRLQGINALVLSSLDYSWGIKGGWVPTSEIPGLISWMIDLKLCKSPYKTYEQVSNQLFVFESCKLLIIELDRIFEIANFPIGPLAMMQVAAKLGLLWLNFPSYGAETLVLT